MVWVSWENWVAKEMYTWQFGPMTQVRYAARLGTFSGTMLVVGGIIGSGIFLSPSVVAQRVGSAPLTLAAWGLGAVVAILGGFVYAELGRRRPQAGGTYVYLRDAFGTFPAFLYGWALFLIVATGAMAAVAMTGANCLVFADWIFFGSTAASLFVLRARDRNSDGRAQLHPLGILTFIAAAVYVLVGSVQSNPGNAARGAGLLLLGIPVYLYWNHRRSRTGDVAT